MLWSLVKRQFVLNKYTLLVRGQLKPPPGAGPSCCVEDHLVAYCLFGGVVVSMTHFVQRSLVCLRTYLSEYQETLNSFIVKLIMNNYFIYFVHIIGTTSSYPVQTQPHGMYDKKIAFLSEELFKLQLSSQWK